MLVANRASTEVIDVFIDLNMGTVYLYITPTTHYSDSPLLRRPIFPTMQNKLNPQIHGLTRCIQQGIMKVLLQTQFLLYLAIFWCV
jgi:hypothetical protein